MGGGKDSSTSVTIPPELKPIYERLGTDWSSAMDRHPMDGEEDWVNRFGVRQDYGEGPFGSQNEWRAPGSPPQYKPDSNLPGQGGPIQPGGPVRPPGFKPDSGLPGGGGGIQPGGPVHPGFGGGGGTPPQKPDVPVGTGTQDTAGGGAFAKPAGSFGGMGGGKQPRYDSDMGMAKPGSFGGMGGGKGGPTVQSGGDPPEGLRTQPAGSPFGGFNPGGSAGGGQSSQLGPGMSIGPDGRITGTPTPPGSFGGMGGGKGSSQGGNKMVDDPTIPPAGPGDPAVPGIPPTPPGGGGPPPPPVDPGAGGGGGDAGNGSANPWGGYSAPTNLIPSGYTSPLTGGSGGFYDPIARPVAGASPMMDWAAGQMGGLFGTNDALSQALGAAGDMTGAGAANPYGTDAISAAQAALARGGSAPTGDTLKDNPVLEAARAAFEQSSIPMLANRRSLMGLGRSDALGHDISSAWADQAVPLMESELGRQERANERSGQLGMGLADLFSGLGSEEGRQRLQATGLLGQLGGQDWSQRMDTLLNSFGMGQSGREIAQEGNDALYEDLVRRQGLWENLWMAPMGQAPNTFGEYTRPGGGMFK